MLLGLVAATVIGVVVYAWKVRGIPLWDQPKALVAKAKELKAKAMGARGQKASDSRGSVQSRDSAANLPNDLELAGGVSAMVENPAVR